MNTCPICTTTNRYVRARLIQGVQRHSFTVSAAEASPVLVCCSDCAEVATALHTKQLGDAAVSGATTRLALVTTALAAVPPAP